MTEPMYEAYARKRGTEEWRPVTDEGLKFYAPRAQMLQRLSQLAQYFPQNEYTMHPVELTNA